MQIRLKIKKRFHFGFWAPLNIICYFFIVSQILIVFFTFPPTVQIKGFKGAIMNQQKYHANQT
jgi:hypothetical protein